MNTKEKYFGYYKVYGLKIKSEVVMKQLVTIPKCKEEEIDVVIEYGKMPDEVDTELKTGAIYSLEKEKMWVKIKDIAIYYVTKGNSILIEPIEDRDGEMLKNYLLGLVSWMLFVQRDEVALHGASIVRNEQEAITVLGDSGSGKSTLTNTLLQNGYKLIADDLSVVAIDDYKVKVKPGYPQQKLSGEMLHRMGEIPGSYKLIDKTRDKYAIPSGEQFVDENQLLKTIYELKVGEVDKVQHKEILGYEKVITLMKYIGTRDVIHHIGLDNVYLGKCIELAKLIRIVQLIRPQGKMTVNEQIAVVEKYV